MKQAYLKYGTSLLLFGTNGIVASYILLNSYEIVFLRTLIGSLFLITVFVLSRSKFKGWSNKKHLGYLIVSGASMGASWMFLYEAYSQIGVSIATLACYCGPVIVMAVSPFIFHERLTGKKILGLIAVLLGMILVNGNDFIHSGISWGLFCGMMSAVMYAFMIIFNKKAVSITGMENTLCQLTASFFAVTVFILITQGISIKVTAHNLLPILILGIINTGAGCYLYFSSIQKLPAQSVAICGYLEPLSALIFSVILLQERLTFLQLIGAVFILGGAAYGEYKKGA